MEALVERTHNRNNIKKHAYSYCLSTSLRKLKAGTHTRSIYIAFGLCVTVNRAIGLYYEFKGKPPNKPVCFL